MSEEYYRCKEKDGNMERCGCIRARLGFRLRNRKPDEPHLKRSKTLSNALQIK